MRQDPVQSAFSHLLISGTLVHEGNFCDLQQTYGISIHPHLVMVVSVDRYPDLIHEKPIEWRQELGQKVIDAIEKIIKMPFTWIWTEEGVIALLIEVSKAQQVNQAWNLQIVQAAKSIQKSVASSDISVSIGIGNYYEDPNMLHDSYREAIQSMSGRFFQGNQLIFQYGQENEMGEVWEDTLAADKTECIALLSIGDEQGVIAHLQALLTTMAEACQYNEHMFKSQVVDLVIMMSRAVIDTGVNATTVLIRNAQFIQELYTTIRYDKFVQKVIEYGQWISMRVGQTQTPKVSNTIRKVILYMKQNHLNSFSLEELARFSCLSKYHFSHLFKKEVGVSVMDFLNQIRIEKAVYYIQTTDLSIKQIASQVGFQDANYFSRMFKKQTGHSPKEYRTAKSC